MTDTKNSEPIFETDVIVVGAGATGVGVAIALLDAGVEDIVVVDMHGVGASFERWPKETCFLTPSFSTNAIGMLDINSVAIATSSAFTLKREHPTGKDYAHYLQLLSKHFAMPVRDGIEVTAVSRRSDAFAVHTKEGIARARFVVWAGGEFQYPRTDAFPGAELYRTVVRLSGIIHLAVLRINGYYVPPYG